ncbi:hypothetical protein ACFWGJ_43675, partial [Streptomyces sp. NPDC060205]
MVLRPFRRSGCSGDPHPTQTPRKRTTRPTGPGATAEEPTAADWLAMPQQRLAEVTGGAVFHD